MLGVIMLGVITLGVIMLGVIMLGAIMPISIILSVIMQTVIYDECRYAKCLSDASPNLFSSSLSQSKLDRLWKMVFLIIVGRTIKTNRHFVLKPLSNKIP